MDDQAVGTNAPTGMPSNESNGPDGSNYSAAQNVAPPLDTAAISDAVVFQQRLQLLTATVLPL